VFEHSSPRLILGSGWTTQTLVGASGGSYGRSPSGSGVAWFAFTGDSVAYQLARDFSAANEASLFVDGVWKADIDMATVFANAAVTTATISFDGLGAGARNALVIGGAASSAWIPLPRPASRRSMPRLS
jgi:hypothetical protein